MFSIVELKTAALDYGIPGVSPAHMLLLFLVAYAIPMIPYLFLYLSLRDGKRGASLKASPVLESTEKPFGKITTLLHAHRHSEPLHH